MDLTRLSEPIVQAPLAGGVSTPELTAAVSSAGGLGFLAAAYKTVETVRQEIETLRSLTTKPFGVNMLASLGPASDPAPIESYAATLQSEAQHYGAEVGSPRHDDDDFTRKIELACEEHVAIVSFTFGCPERAVVARLQQAGCDVWMTVTNPDEAAQAQSVGADALVVQGFEAGGHRASFSDRPDAEDLGVLAAVRLVGRRVALPLIAAGGIADGAMVAAVLCAGAVAAQVGSALMLSPEAGTADVYRAALAGEASTRLTRAFSGRRGRGIVNRFMREHDAEAPIAYPDVHYVTEPIVAAAREAGDAEAQSLWAGQTHVLARSEPAASIVKRLGSEAREAAEQLVDRLGPRDPDAG